MSGRSGGFGGARGTLSQQQDRINQANAVSRGNIAPGVAAGFSRGMNNATARRTINTTPSYEMSLRNMYELSKMMPGPGMGISALGGALGVPGMGPSFTGARGTVNGPGDYDPTNRFGTMDSAMFRPKQGMPGIQAAGLPRAAPAQAPNLQQLQVPAATLGGPIPGLGNYQVNLPSYGYFGTPPAQQRPQSAILNPLQGMRRY